MLHQLMATIYPFRTRIGTKIDSSSFAGWVGLGLAGSAGGMMERI